MRGWGYDLEDEIRRAQFISLRKERYRKQARAGMKSIRSILLDAAYHTQAVMARAHVQPGHDIMIGQFITSLKSELQGHPLKSKFSNLTAKCMWDNILVLSSATKGMVDEETRNMINEAKTDFQYNYDGFDSISRRLEAMKSGPDSLMIHVKAMKDLNVQAEHIMNSLSELADTLEE
jgi:hypothetical protein